jgi:hypothetical protein
MNSMGAKEFLFQYRILYMDRKEGVVHVPKNRQWAHKMPMRDPFPHGITTYRYRDVLIRRKPNKYSYSSFPFPRFNEHGNFDMAIHNGGFVTVV